MRARSSWIRRLAQNTGLAAGATLLALGLAFAAGEAWLRAKHGNVPPGPPDEWAVYDAERGWAMKPGRYSYFDVRAARRADVSINELGLRQGPLAPQPAPGVERIALVGDSFVFGPPVDQHETIPARLQALAGPRYEVLNVSAPGYGTGQQLRLLQTLHAKGYHLGRRVVLMFFTNDIQDNLGLEYSTLARNARQPAFGFDGEGKVLQSAVAPPQPRRERAGPGLLDRLMFSRYLRYQAEVVVVSNPALIGVLERAGFAPRLPRTPGIVAGWYAPGWEERWSVTERLLEHAVRALREFPEEPELWIALVPSPFQMPGAFRHTLEAGAAEFPAYARLLEDPDRPQRLVGGVAKRLGLRFVDLTPALHEAAQTQLVYFPREGHFNEAGCELVARVLHKELMQ